MNNTIKNTVARLLLLYFVIAIIPLDLYHRHVFPDTKGDKPAIAAAKGISQSIFTSHCLVCDFHFNHHHAYQESIPLLLSFYETAGSLVLFHYQQAIYENAAVPFNLRGPPIGQVLNS